MSLLVSSIKMGEFFDPKRPDGRPIFGDCAKLGLIFVTLLTLIATVLHFIANFSTHFLANTLPRVLKTLSDREIETSRLIEEFV